MIFGKRIKAIRQEKKMTQKDLANKLGVSAPAVSQFENKNSNLELKTIKKIAEALEVPYTDLIEEGTLLINEYQPKHAKEMVNHPEHYNQGKHECIDEMIALFGIEDVIAFCKCNIYKYKTRASHKNGDEDLAKADWYMDKLLELQGEIKC